MPRFVSKRAIRVFTRLHPESLRPLQNWARVVQAALWEGTADVRATFRSTDFVGDLTVFNVGGNRFRVIAYVHFRRRAVYLKHILTHAEYDKGDWKQ